MKNVVNFFDSLGLEEIEKSKAIDISGDMNQAALNKYKGIAFAMLGFCLLSGAIALVNKGILWHTKQELNLIESDIQSQAENIFMPLQEGSAQITLIGTMCQLKEEVKLRVKSRSSDLPKDEHLHFITSGHFITSAIVFDGSIKNTISNENQNLLKNFMKTYLSKLETKKTISSCKQMAALTLTLATISLFSYTTDINILQIDSKE